MRAFGRASVLLLSLGAIVGLFRCSSSDSTSPDAGTQTGGSGGGTPVEPILDGGGQPAVPPDGMGLCPVGACNFQTGQGCPANMTCAPSAMDGKTPQCEAAGTKALGTACTAWTECAPGAICAGGFCRKICCGRDWTGCPEGEHCLRKFEVQLMADGGAIDTGAYLCFPVNTCSSLDPSSCAAMERGTTCQIADPTGATACLPEGTGETAQPCPCKGGFTCVNNGCRRLCKAVAGGGAPSCAANEGRCVHFTKDPDGVGECTP